MQGPSSSGPGSFQEVNHLVDSESEGNDASANIYRYDCL